jgi:peptide/nickel transport system permease protein
MTAYIIRRLLMGVIVLILVTFLVFLIMRLLPGDPLVLYLSENDINNLTEQQLADMRHEFGLDKPVMIQYFDWIGGVVQGNLGTSLAYHETVGHLIIQRIPITIHLGALAFIFGSILGIAFGVVCALKRGKWIDTVVTVLANLGITVPSFWVGILLIYLFALKLDWLPVYGYTSPFEDFWLSTKQILMPVFCLAIFNIASLTRQTRSSMLEVVQQDYIRTAWAKGLRQRVIILRHTIKNALIPPVTTMGMHVGIIFGGAVLIETVFNIPGMGRLLKDAIYSQDYQVVQGGVLIVALVIVLTNIAVDISYGWFDPRIRYN